MKFLLDFLPIILFFGSYTYADGHRDWAAQFISEHFGALISGGRVSPDEAPVMLATLVVIPATLATVAWLKGKGQKVGLMLWISLGTVVVLGGLTLWLHSETFIKWKPSVLYWTMGLLFWVSQTFFRKNLLRMQLGEQMELPETVWHRLNFAWIFYFGMMGLLNLWVAYSFDTRTWVRFKTFGGLGISVVFILAQGFYMSRYIKDDAPATPAPGDSRP
jgi:intracellular septation protein